MGPPAFGPSPNPSLYFSTIFFSSGCACPGDVSSPSSAAVEWSDGLCYMKDLSPRTFQEARDNCQALGMDLAEFGASRASYRAVRARLGEPCSTSTSTLT